MRDKIKAAWLALVAKRTAPGWLLFFLSALFWLSDKWDSLNSLIVKMKNMGPFFKFIIDAAQSPLVQMSVFILGILWIGRAAVIAARKTGSSFAGVDFGDAVITPIERPHEAVLLRRIGKAPSTAPQA